MEFKSKRKFLVRDPFNPENLLEGIISIDRGMKYGAFQIHKINGEKIDHPVILGTPKMRYPFDQNGNWHFPSAKEILCYEKYDGTNIFAYRYFYKGRAFLTYKVRLFPFLRGPFLNLWKEILKKYPRIPILFSLNPDFTGFSFELYGNDNHHLIQYDHKIDTRILFGLKEGGNIFPPKYLNLKDTNIKEARLEKEVSRDYIYEYQSLQEQYEKTLKTTESGYEGREGSIWYLKTKKDDFRIFKCKPPTIERIHWSMYPLDLNVIKATACNVLELWDTVTYKNLVELLLEEFPKEQIELSEKRIQKVLIEFDEKEVFNQRVSILLKDLPENLDIKTEIMPYLSKFFEKKEMGSVYQSVVFLKER